MPVTHCGIVVSIRVGVCHALRHTQATFFEETGKPVHLRMEPKSRAFDLVHLAALNSKRPATSSVVVVFERDYGVEPIIATAELNHH
jgi:hypothetical protein